MKVYQLTIGAIILGGLLLGGLLWGIPVYKVYSAEQSGKAILAKAEYSKQAQIQDAMAKKESAKYLAEGAAIIKSSLSPEYLRYLEIQMQEQVGERNDAAVYFFDSKPVISPLTLTPKN